MDVWVFIGHVCESVCSLHIRFKKPSNCLFVVVWVSGVTCYSGGQNEWAMVFSKGICVVCIMGVLLFPTRENIYLYHFTLDRMHLLIAWLSIIYYTRFSQHYKIVEKKLRKFGPH